MNTYIVTCSKHWNTDQIVRFRTTPGPPATVIYAGLGTNGKVDTVVGGDLHPRHQRLGVSGMGRNSGSKWRNKLFTQIKQNPLQAGKEHLKFQPFDIAT